MVKAKDLDTVKRALELVKSTSPPTYSQMDCQAFVEHCVNHTGSPKINYRGSNHMFRSACLWLGEIPLASA